MQNSEEKKRSRNFFLQNEYLNKRIFHTLEKNQKKSEKAFKWSLASSQQRNLTELEIKSEAKVRKIKSDRERLCHRGEADLRAISETT